MSTVYEVMILQAYRPCSALLSLCLQSHMLGLDPKFVNICNVYIIGDQIFGGKMMDIEV